MSASITSPRRLRDDRSAPMPSEDGIDEGRPHGVRKLDSPPEGWIPIPHASTPLYGWRWWSNGKSRFGGEYESALVREEES